MIIQTKNNISQHCTPPSSASLPAAEVTLTTSTTNGPRQQQQQPQSQLQPSGPPHYVDLHVNAGECVSLQLLDGQEQVVSGPATLTMISQQPNPPVPIPVQVPPGHMIHQIADENGTLKHIILSVMDGNEDGSQLDSTVITLPQGTFRIDSNGELVSTSERASSGESGSATTALTTLPQQAYFANYDGCPPNTYEAAPTANIEPIANSNKSQPGAPVESYQGSSPTTPAIATSGELNEKTVNNTESIVRQQQKQQGSNNKHSTNTNSTPINKTNANTSSNLVSSDNKAVEQSNTGGVDLASGNKQITLNGTIKGAGGTQQQQQQTGGNIASYDKVSGTEEGNSKEAIQADPQQQQQVVVPAGVGEVAASAAAYSAPHQVMSNEMDLMGSGIAPIMSTVDGQLYGYPPCCCCCYCDPAQEAAAAAAAAAAGIDQAPPLAGLPGQQDVGLLVGGCQQQQQAASDQMGAGGSSRPNCRAMAAGSNGSFMTAYANPMLGAGGNRQPAMQSQLAAGVPIALATGAHLAQPLAGQNGIVPVPSGGGSGSSAHVADNAKVHPAGGKGGRNGYKQLKMVPGLANSQAAGAERGQQSGYGGSQGGHHKAYNSIVSGHHHHSHQSSNHHQHHNNHQHHHNHHNQQQQQQQHHHYNQSNTDASGGSQGASVAPPSAFKNQALLVNHTGGGYSASQVYSSYNHVPTAANATANVAPTTNQVVSGGNSGSSSKSPSQSSQLGSNGALVYGSSKLVQSGANGPANYQQQQHHGGRTGPNSDSNYMQRASRDHANTYGHSNSNNSASGYVQTNLRQMSQQQQQHQHSNENKQSRQNNQLSDKNSQQQQQQAQHNNRYANVKGMSNNHNLINNSASCHSLSHQSPGSVSPIRARMKATSSQQQQQQNHNHHHNHNNNNHHNHHQHHHNHPSDLSGARASHHYSQMNEINKQDASDMNNLQSANNYHNGRDFSQLNHSKSTSKNNLYLHEAPLLNNQATAGMKHINSATGGYYSQNLLPAHKQAGGAWQSGGQQHKFNQLNKPVINDSASIINETPTTQRGGDKITPAANKQVAVTDTTEMSYDATDGGHLLPCSPSTDEPKESASNEESSLRASPNKQDKCHNKNQSPDSPSNRYKRPPSKATSKQSGESSSHSAENDANKTSTSSVATTTTPTTTQTTTTTSDNKTSPKTDASKSKVSSAPPGGKQQAKQQEVQAKRAVKEKAAGQQKAAAKQLANESTFANDDTGKISEHEVPVRKRKHSQASVGASVASSDQKRSSDSLNETSDLSSESSSQHSRSLNNKNKLDEAESELVLRVKRQVNDKAEPKSITESDRLELAGKSEGEPAESHSSELGQVDDLTSIASRPESPGSLKSSQLSRLVMRTSLSENNIQSLDSHQLHQQAKQKLLVDLNIAATLRGVSATSNRKKANDSTATGGGGGGSKKRSNNAAKSDHKVKLSAIPQLRILNLNCTSISSSSVQLRWSYNPLLADKYGLHQYGSHHHHHAKNALMDHFVIESSSSKNVDSNTLVSPKIVYQGCALTCRISHLSPEKIYHFKVRRTALVTVSSDSSEPTATTSGEHSIVSEILSVTLPGVQQQQNNNGGANQSTTGGNNSKKGYAGSRQQRGGSLDGSSSDHHNQSLAGNLSEEYQQHHNHHHHNRGTTSSHNNNNNNNNSNNNSKQSSHSQSIKFTNLFRQCRGKFVTTIGKLIKNSLSSYSDTKFAGLLLVMFTIFAMLLAVFIHLYIVAPVTE